MLTFLVGEDFLDELGPQTGVALAHFAVELDVDVVAQVRSRTKGVAFVAQEIYKDNDINKGFRPQVGAWHLPTEPWTFVIDKSGKIVQRFEGALSVAELQAAVDKVAPRG